jgi:nicotinate-nucleotide pyrophosphorylase (carboxylating)
MKQNLDLLSFINPSKIISFLLLTIEEDQSTIGDISTLLLVPAKAHITAKFVSREQGVVSGLAILPFLISTYNQIDGSKITLNLLVHDGDTISPGQVLAEISGSHRAILGLERIALNIICRLSAISSLTSEYVKAIAEFKTELVDSRKTHPGMRELSKYAVACGGAVPNRFGLYDAVLWKDNHIAHIPLDKLATEINNAIVSSKQVLSITPKYFEIEVDSLEQLDVLLDCKLDYIMLDNMNIEQISEAVARRNNRESSIKLEASGGVTLTTISKIAATGIERISVGALTHSANILDIGLDVL